MRRFVLTDAETTAFVAFLSASAEIVEADEEAIPPIRDPNDVHIIQTAIAGKTEYLCTLDEDFYETAVVEFCSNRGIKIVSDLTLLRLVRGGAAQV